MTDTPPKIDINDKEGLKKAMDALKPGEFIEVQGNGGPLTVSNPSLEEDVMKSFDSPRCSQKDDSWFD